MGGACQKRRRRKAKAAEKAARLAPPEEKAHAPAAKQTAGDNGNGAIVFDPTTFHVPNDFSEEGKEGSRILGLDPVVAAVVALALAFIAFVSVLITLMPPKN
ncbi:MAG: hypothetical protein WKF30_01240 [Pyrinomonadaceae bacterium]